MKLTFERKLPIVLFFVFLTLVSVGFVSYQYTVSLKEAVQRKSEAQNVVSLIDRTLTNLLDADSYVQGFYFTGNSTYGDRFEERRRQTGSALKELELLTSANPEQRANLEALKIAFLRYWQIADRRINDRKQLGPEAVQIEPSVLEFKTSVTQIRAELDRMRSVEQGVAAGYADQLDSNIYRTVWILIFASVAGIISLLVANVLVLTESRRRASAESAIVEANRNLEARVVESTNELREVNRDLELVAAERAQLLENEQAARREAEIANRLRDEFMATISHELRTPLNSILGWARMLKAGSLDGQQEEKALNTIIKSSETQNRLIEDLLDVARVISGKLNLEMRPISVAEVVNHSIESIRPSARAKRISVSVTIGEETNQAEVVGDHYRLEQVFTNLLTNSVKFTPDRGSIDVSVTSNNGLIEIAISDSGIGISSNFLPLVFERFRQDVATEGRNGGLGLGLAIVRNIVEMHGGSVRAESKGENQGSTFTVLLPLRRSEVV
jgi:signal transduction histidine kinase